MHINHHLNINGLKTNKFFIFILAIQLAVISIFSLKFIGISIPVLGSLITFIYVTFIPGILILRIIKLKNINKIESLLYSIGLSLAFLMILGFILNNFSQIIYKPISSYNIIVSFNLIVITLIIISYFMEKQVDNVKLYESLDLSIFYNYKFLLLLLTPFLTIVGTYFMNFYQINILLLLMIVLISLIVLLVVYEKIPSQLYPFAVFVISISLLYHSWLISMYIWGTDIHSEYYFANLTLINSYWNWTIPSNTNAMLSITILAPLYQIFTNIDLTWVFKIVYPFLFSMVPLCLYEVFKKQTNEKIAFLASFFFVSSLFYVTWLIPLKQQLAELFLVLILLLIINQNMDGKNRSFLLITFGFCMVFSHYGTSYLFLGTLVFSWILLSIFFKRDIFQKKSNNRNILNTTLIILFIVFAIAWYMYVSDSNALKSIIGIVNNIFSSVTSSFLSTESTEGLRYVAKTPQTSIGYIQKGLYVLTSFFIFIGVLGTFRKNRFNFRKEYISFSVIFLFICIASVLLPYFSKAMDTQRLYHLTLIILAPFCITGGILVFKLFNRIFHFIKIFTMNNIYKILSVLLIFFFLINVGFVDELAGTHRLDSIPFSIGSSKLEINVFEQDINCGRWLSNNGDNQFGIYSDRISRSSLVSYSGVDWMNRALIMSIPPGNNINGFKYIFFSYQNVVNNIVMDTQFNKHNMTEVNSFVENNDLIYSNGGTELVFHTS